jgi:uncharacterized protein YjiS (DUF1127 family)
MKRSIEMSTTIMTSRLLRRSRILSLFADLFALWSRALRRQRTIADMSLLSDHQLRDIGISRAEIPHAVDHGRPRF